MIIRLDLAETEQKMTKTPKKFKELNYFYNKKHST